MPYLLDTNAYLGTAQAEAAWRGASVWVRKTSRGISLHLCGHPGVRYRPGIDMDGAQQPEKAVQIETWLDDLAETYNVARRRTPRPFSAAGRNSCTVATIIIWKIALIAATALVHDLTVATRNTDDFNIVRRRSHQSVF